VNILNCRINWGDFIMRKVIAALMVLILILVNVFIIGCTPESSNSENKGNTELARTTESAFKITLDDIKGRYSDSDVKIKNIQNIGQEWVLVQSQKETFADKFDIYNLRTGDMDSIQEGFEYVTLEKVVNENYFVFLSSGKNSESIYGDFPHLINSIRIKNELNAGNDFISFNEDKYFKLDYSVSSGSKEHAVLSEIIVTFDGFEVMFGPRNDNDMEFYIDATDIPQTKTSYNKDKKQMIFELATDQIGSKFKNRKKIDVDGNQFISSLEISRKDNKTYLTVGIKEITKEYMVKKNHLPNQLPYFSVSFREEEQ
jgi:hypothetical protein